MATGIVGRRDGLYERGLLHMIAERLHASKPHVIFTLVDDWGYELWPRADDGYSHKQLLPTLAKIFVDEGLQLARHYTMSYCAPSRQSLLSGRLPLHVNEENSVCSGIPREMRTIADQLTLAGYATHVMPHVPRTP